MAFDIAVICAVVLVAFYRTLFFKVIVDDIPRYKEIAAGYYKMPRPLWHQFTKVLYYRLYGAGTFGMRTIADHAFAIFLHGLTCVMMYFVFGQNKISLAAALIYAVHPSNHQTAIWLNGRRYSINNLLILTMMLLPKPFGLLAWIITPVFQATAVFAPVALGWPWMLVVPVVILLGAKKWRRLVQGRMSMIMNDDQRHYRARNIIVTFKLFWFYYKRLMMPGRTFMSYPHLYQWGITEKGNKDAYAFDKRFFLGIAALALCIYGCITFPAPQKFYLMFMVLATVQWCGLIPAVQHSTDRYIAAALMFAAYLTAWMDFTFLGAYAVPVLVFTGAYYFFNLNDAMDMYPDIIHFHNYHNYFDPKNTLTRFTMANGFLNIKQPLNAWYQIMTGLDANPDDFKLNYLAAFVCMVMQDKVNAKIYIDRARKNIEIGQWDIWKKKVEEIDLFVGGTKFSLYDNPKPRMRDFVGGLHHAAR